jgi:YVTN family beta-propeller protein
VSVIDTATNAVVGSTRSSQVGAGPFGVAVTPDGSRVYVANLNGNTVSVIDTGTNAVVATLPVGMCTRRVRPVHPAGEAAVRRDGRAKNCAGQSVAAVTRQHRGMPRAASALGYASVADLQAAIRTFCNA